MLNCHPVEFLSADSLNDRLREDILRIVENNLSTKELAAYYSEKHFGEKYEVPGSPHEKVFGGNAPLLELKLEIALSDLISKLMVEPSARSQLINSAKRYHTYFSNSFRRCRQDNLCRGVDGDLFTTKQIQLFLRHKANARNYLYSAAYHSDPEAIKIGQALKGNEQYQGHSGLIALFNSMGRQVPAELTPKTKMSPSNYIRTIFTLTGAEQKQFLKDDYRKEVLIDQGSLIFEAIFRSSLIAYDPAHLDLLADLVRKGADWYLGFKLAIDSPIMRLDLIARQPDLISELKELYTHRNQNVKMAILILTSQASEVKAELCSNQSMADRLFKFTQDPDLLKHVSKRCLSNRLSNDLQI